MEAIQLNVLFNAWMKICDEWSISDKAICLVSDTCNNMKKVGQEFGKSQYL